MRWVTRFWTPVVLQLSSKYRSWVWKGEPCSGQHNVWLVPRVLSEKKDQAPQTSLWLKLVSHGLQGRGTKPALLGLETRVSRTVRKRDQARQLFLGLRLVSREKPSTIPLNSYLSKGMYYIHLAFHTECLMFSSGVQYHLHSTCFSGFSIEATWMC